jgi:hypothetical protein
VARKLHRNGEFRERRHLAIKKLKERSCPAEDGEYVGTVAELPSVRRRLKIGVGDPDSKGSIACRKISMEVRPWTASMLPRIGWIPGSGR